VFTEPAVPVGYDTRGLEEHARVANAMRLCTATSFIGVPALAVPTHLAGGLPQGVQVIASFYREDLCFEAAAAIEARLGTFAPIDPRPGARQR
jgi:amidase